MEWIKERKGKGWQGGVGGVAPKNWGTGDI